MAVVVKPMVKEAGSLTMLNVQFGICADGALYLEGPYGFFKQCKRDGTVDGIN